MTSVKICGLKSIEHIEVATSAGARYLGFVFFEKSPRNVSTSRAKSLALTVPAGIMKVGLFVSPSDKFLDDVCNHVPLDMIQLHGDESPDRVQEIRERFGLPIMKALGISHASDLTQIENYTSADQFLLDAKPPKGANLPGGNGVTFDWNILKNAKIKNVDF